MSDTRLDAARTPEERERLAEIDGRLEKATAGRWDVVASHVYPGGLFFISAICQDGQPAPIGQFGAEGDACLAASAPADLLYLRALLDQRDAVLSDARDDAPTPWRELEVLRRQVAVMRAALERITQDSHGWYGNVAREALEDVDNGNGSE